MDHQETAGIADPALEEIPVEIVEAQSTEVDVVSGATRTSEGIIEAVDETLIEAGL
ncbi:FMN-binding protein [Fuchsiella alkaliacetigena]|uniref:FMN-binding protein n=1 Tax=Fuchsiella alkaliacetigena TaxID=957042 RepID=UPI00200B20A3|nr:FMN-binding protein [Fuchsiella alkaliacetigena]MCK8824421.1 FMN-binding protein [Fuchsiella alkaliacetigena]